MFEASTMERLFAKFGANERACVRSFCGRATCVGSFYDVATFHRCSQSLGVEYGISGKQILSVLRVLAVYRALILRVLRVFRSFMLSDTSILAVFRGSILRLLPVLEELWGSILFNTACI